MKKFILVLMTIILIVIIFLIGKNLLNSHPVSEGDQKSIARTVNNYYMDIEKKQVEHALSYIYYENKNMNKYIDPQSNELALKEILQNVYLTFHVENQCNYQDVFYDKTEKSYYSSVGLNLKYKGTSGGLVTEILYLNKFSGRWKIVKIKSADRYIVFRSNNYTVEYPLMFLIPGKQ